MLRFNERVILIKAEETYGTDPTPTGSANAIQAFDVEFNPDAGENLVRDYVKPTVGNTGQQRVLPHATLAFSVELQGSGTAGLAPAWGPLMPACSFEEAVVADTSVTYSLVEPEAATDSAAAYFYASTSRHALLGMRGNVSLDCQPNRVPMLRFSFMGFRVDPAADTVPTPVFTAWKRGLVMSKANTPTFTLHGASAVLRSLQIDLANQVVHRDGPNLAEMQITDREPSGNIVIEAPALGTKDWFAAAKAETLDDLQLILGATAGSIVTVNAPMIQVLNPQYQDVDNARFLAMPLNVCEDTGNDEFEIVLT